MTLPVYRFRNFRLDPQARELYQDGALVALPVSTLDCLIYLIRHRDRSVGRDELTAAVWDRVDVSDVSLSHAIMRLRRLLGDTGSDQNSIRTVQRLGYRWIVEPTVEEEPVRASAAETTPALPAASSGRAAAPAGLRVPHGRRLGLLLLGCAGLAAFALQPAWRRVDHAPAAPAKRQPAMVLPAEVEAQGDWAWLRLGLMDLIANRLRRGDLATTPSETVVSLVDAQRRDGGAMTGRAAAFDAATLSIQPHVARSGSRWSVRLEARRDGTALVAQAQAGDALAAGRAAADDLLVKLGHMPPRDEPDESSLAIDELAQRVSAAALAGQLQIARELIRNAPAAVQASPQIGLGMTKIEFFSGDYEASRKRGESLLDQVPADRNPRLRARILNSLGVTYFRLERLEDADRAFADAIGLLELLDEPDELAADYTGRGVVAGRQQRLDAAAEFFGRARTLHEMSNDAFGVARVDLNLGAVAMDRGQPAAAAPIFADAAERFERLSTPEALNSALRSLADAQSMLLEHDLALATTERFWPPEAHGRNPRENWWLTLSRAVALAGKGRLSDADDLVRRVREASDPVGDAVVRLEAEAVAADLALSRGRPADAAAHAEAAMKPELEASNPQDYLSAWVTRIRALQRGGRTAEAGVQVARLRAWGEAAPSEARRLYATLAEADQRRIEEGSTAALPRYAEAMALADRTGIPENLLVAGEPYVEALLDAGRVDQASAIAGRLAPWSGQDVRAAWVQVQVYRALRKDDAASAALERTRLLAGERNLAGDP